VALWCNVSMWEEGREAILDGRDQVTRSCGASSKLQGGQLPQMKTLTSGKGYVKTIHALPSLRERIFSSEGIVYFH